MPLQSGTRFGPYEILALIGAGGMGEVYRGRDTRLDRVVAIKILPAHLAEQADLRERFEREAHAVAALNHANVCTLFDIGQQDGVHFLVMEYLEGETVADRLKSGPLPLDEALKYAVEIASALDKAHRQGIIHRDLKPGNVMLTKSGAKLLDFGLARLKRPEAAAAFSSLSVLPTNASAITAQGAIIGTLQYMAPEQLEGKEADARTDIFAFGTLLYEMTTGRKAFEGKSQVSLIGAILEREPTPITTFQPSIPPALDRVIRRCLAKDPDERWQSASDLAAELTWVVETGTHEEKLKRSVAASSDVSVITRKARLWMAAAGGLFLLAAAFAVALVFLYRPSETPNPVQFSIAAPEKTIFDSGAGSNAGYSAGSVSPDGSRIAFTARDNMGKLLLWIRPLGSLAAQSFPGTDGAAFPFWSPDSRSIGFFAQGKLKKIDVAGGPPQILCDAVSGRGGSWNRDGIILFSPNVTDALYRVSSAGGAPIAVTALTPPQTGHRFPLFLPDGRHFVYFATRSDSPEILLGTLDSKDGTHLLAADSPALYSPSGHLLFVRQGTLLAQPFDTQKFQLNGEAVPVAQDVAVSLNALGASVSNNGTLTYRTELGGSGNLQLTWLDRTGKPIVSVGTPGTYRGVDVSPDGKKIAVHRHDGNGGDIWVVESSAGPFSRLTFDPSQENSAPVWSPDGGRIAFASLRGGKWGIYQKLANGTGTEELLFASDAAIIPMSWSADGKFIVYFVRDLKTSGDLWVLPVTGDRKPFSIVQGPSNQALPHISLDGKWIAYWSNETGRVEVYVKPFPSGEGHWQVTTNGSGNFSVRWSEKELFYIDPSSTKMMAIPFNAAGSNFQWGIPRELFDTGYVGLSHAAYHDFAVSRDGQRFLIPRPESATATQLTATPITVVLNWPSLLKPR